MKHTLTTLALFTLALLATDSHARARTVGVVAVAVAVAVCLWRGLP